MEKLIHKTGDAQNIIDVLQFTGELTQDLRDLIQHHPAGYTLGEVNTATGNFEIGMRLRNEPMVLTVKPGFYVGLRNDGALIIYPPEKIAEEYVPAHSMAAIDIDAINAGQAVELGSVIPAQLPQLEGADDDHAEKAALHELLNREPQELSLPILDGFLQYTHKPTKVRAAQYVLNTPHDKDTFMRWVSELEDFSVGISGDDIHVFFDTELVTIKPGQVLVVYPDGKVDVTTKEAFLDNYELVPELVS